MRMHPFRFVAIAMLLIALAVPSTALAAKPSGPTYDQLVAQLQASSNPQAAFDALSDADKATLEAPNAVARTTIVSTGSGNGGASKYATLATKCYYAYWIAQAVNAIGKVLFQYKEQVNWCSDGTKITSLSRFTQPITPQTLLWVFDSETLFDISYAAGKVSAWCAARGTFNQLLAPLGIVIGQSHPLVQITVKANGTATGSISW